MEGLLSEGQLDEDQGQMTIRCAGIEVALAQQDARDPNYSSKWDEVHR